MEEARFQNMWNFLAEANYADLEEVGVDMKCTICSRILINAHRATSCGCKYCLGCVRNFLGGDRRFCPTNTDVCQWEALDIGRNILPDHATNYRISKLIVGCRYSCGSRCELRSMEEHERACGRQPARCPYADMGCTETQLVGDRIDGHLARASRLHAALVAARLGQLQGEISTLANMRTEIAVVANENSVLVAAVRRYRTGLFGLILLIICSGALANVAWLGLLRTVGELEANAEMRNSREFVWRVGEWASRIQSVRGGGPREIFSSGFYSHEHGYRMCLSVSPDGSESGTGTHLSLFFYLMQGPFDRDLPWPFRRNVTLALMNQRSGRDHVSHTISFDQFPNHTNWNRPAREREGGFGYLKMVELAELASTAGLIQDDSISVKCVVKDDNRQ